MLRRNFLKLLSALPFVKGMVGSDVEPAITNVNAGPVEITGSPFKWHKLGMRLDPQSRTFSVYVDDRLYCEKNIGDGPAVFECDNGNYFHLGFSPDA